VTNRTHDPALASWVASANAPNGDFPIQNLPFAVFRRAGSGEEFRGGVAIGDQIVDLGAVHEERLLEDVPEATLAAAAEPTLNRFMAGGPTFSSPLRAALSDALKAGSPARAKIEPALVPQADAEYALPAAIGDFTDFYASLHHATTVGAQFRPDNPLLPNYRWIPIAYHGRSSSVGVSPQSFRRPIGQSLPKGEVQPVFGPSRRLDFELELGVFIGSGNRQGDPIAIEDAEVHVFGLCLLNDWSARDLQGWEYQPLGPFLAKNFATTISPWVVTLEALAPFRVAPTRPDTDPAPLPYLNSASNRDAGAIDIRLEAFIQSDAMRSRNAPPHRLSSTSFKHSYWTIAQLVAHHTINGCDLRAGDLLGTGTQSGPTPEEAGSLLELSVGGSRPIEIAPAEQRTFLQDGDTVIFRAWCEKAGTARIGFGEVRGRVLPPQA